MSSGSGEITIRHPTINDGAGMWRVVKEAGVLDLNSSYLYLLMAKDFAETCVVAERDGQVVGFVTGYRPPGREDVIFLWQVGVHPNGQGQGLGKRMLAYFLRSRGAEGAHFLETTVTPSNEPSRALFRSIARALGTECQIGPCFSANQFPETGHEDEELFRIGPYDLSQPNSLRI